jgi:hypothetical protein
MSTKFADFGATRMLNSTTNWMNGPKAFGSIFSQDTLGPAGAISPIRKSRFPAIMQAIREKPTPI